MEIQLTTGPDKWLVINIRSANSEKFQWILDKFKTRLDVVFYDNKYRRYLSSVHEIDNLMKFCNQFGISLSVTESVSKRYENHKRFEKHIARYIHNNKVGVLNIPLWTDDPAYQLYEYQKTCVRVAVYARRFMIGDDMGCIDRDADIIINGRHYTIEEAYNKFHRKYARDGINWRRETVCRTRSLFDDGQFYKNEIKNIVYSGVKETWKVIIKTSKKKYSLRLTPDHELLGVNGWMALNRLNVGDQISVNGKNVKYCEVCKEYTEHSTWKHCKYQVANLRYHPYMTTQGILYHRLVYEAFINGVDIDEWLDTIKYNRFNVNTVFLTPDKIVHHKDRNPLNNSIQNLILCEGHTEHAKYHTDNRKNLPYTVPELGTICKIIKDNKKRRTYDLVMDDPARNFIANGVVVHNCGKTPQAIALALLAWEEYGLKNALFVVKNKLKGQWRDEILKFTKLNRNDIEVIGERICRINDDTSFHKSSLHCKSCKKYSICLHDSDTQKSSAGKYRALQISRARMLVANYEILHSEKKAFLARNFDVVVCDEATMLKNWKNNASKAMKAMSDNMPQDALLILMSGTFVENRIGELFSVFDIVNPYMVGKWYNFKDKYLVTDHFNNVVGYRNEEKLKKKLESVCIRRTIDEVWKDRPTIEERLVECPLEGEQKKFYEDALAGKLADLQDFKKAKKVNMANVATLLNYLLMILDTVKSIDPDTKIKKHSSKMEMLKEMLEDEFPKDAKIIIFCRYAKKVLPHLVSYLRGLNMGKVLYSTSGNDPAKNIRKFRDNKKCRFFVCSDAMAYGMNLQFANYLINFDLPWNPAVLDQRIRRVYRQGQKNGVVVVNFVVPGSVDEHLFRLLSSKRKLFSALFKESLVNDRNVDIDIASILNSLCQK